MSKFSEKVFRGETPTPQDWVEHLKERHRISPSQTPHVYDLPKTKDGLNSYQMLLTAVPQSTRSPRILDLACGDGHLVQYIQKSFGDDVEVVGIDMAEGELEIARTKTFSGKVSFKNAMAHSTGEKDESFDVVLCHMALMLMSPIEPIVGEIARVLKSGGVFAAVVGGGTAKMDFLPNVQKIISEFMKDNFPKYIYSPGGDQRARNTDGLTQIFSNSNFKNIKVIDFNIEVEMPPDESWNFLKDWYHVSLIPEPERTKLKEKIISFAKTTCKGSDRLMFDQTMRLVSVVKD